MAIFGGHATVTDASYIPLVPFPPFKTISLLIKALISYPFRNIVDNTPTRGKSLKQKNYRKEDFTMFTELFLALAPIVLIAGFAIAVFVASGDFKR